MASTSTARSHAPCFDIDWQPPEVDLAEKTLLPVLGNQFGRVLERAELFQEGETFRWWRTCRSRCLTRVP